MAEVAVWHEDLTGMPDGIYEKVTMSLWASHLTGGTTTDWREEESREGKNPLE